jgi:hypothetical protein
MPHQITRSGPQVGYVQGMNFIAGMLFRLGLGELAAFRLFFTLMENFGFGDLYTKHFHGLKVTLVMHTFSSYAAPSHLVRMICGERRLETYTQALPWYCLRHGFGMKHQVMRCAL